MAIVLLHGSGKGGTYSGATADGDGVILQLNGEKETVAFQVVGLTGNTEVRPRITMDGNNWEDIPAVNVETRATAATPITIDGIYRANVQGAKAFKATIANYSDADEVVVVGAVSKESSELAAEAGGGGGTTITDPIGRQAAATSLSTALSTEDKAVLDAIDASLPAPAAMTDAMANPTTTWIGSFGAMWDSVAETWRRVLGDANGLYTWMTNKLDVDNDHVIAVSPLVTLAPAVTVAAVTYAAGEVVGGTTTLADVMEPNPDGTDSADRSASLVSLHLGEKSGLAPALDIYFLRAAPTGTYNDNAALTWDAADLAKKYGPVRIQAADWIVSGGQADVSLGNIGLVMDSADADLRIVIVRPTGAADYVAASTDALSIRLGFERG